MATIDNHNGSTLNVKGDRKIVCATYICESHFSIPDGLDLNDKTKVECWGVKWDRLWIQYVDRTEEEIEATYKAEDCEENWKRPNKAEIIDPIGGVDEYYPDDEEEHDTGDKNEDGDYWCEDCETFKSPSFWDYAGVDHKTIVEDRYVCRECAPISDDDSDDDEPIQFKKDDDDEPIQFKKDDDDEPTKGTERYGLKTKDFNSMSEDERQWWYSNTGGEDYFDNVWWFVQGKDTEDFEINYWEQPPANQKGWVSKIMEDAVNRAKPCKKDQCHAMTKKGFRCKNVAFWAASNCKKHMN